jgi:hypothetical protein
MALSDLKASKPTTKPVEAVSVTTETVSSALTIPGATTTALSAILAHADSGQAPAFPIVAITGGAQGGMFAPIKSTPAEIADLLPAGRKVDGILVAYRTDVTAWPTGYDERATEKPKPSWAFALGATAVDDGVLVDAASHAYQFTPGADKAKFDYATSQIGHLKPTLELLVWCPTTKDLIVVRTPAGYEGWIESIRAISRLANPKTGTVGQIPVVIRCNTASRTNKTKDNTWYVHSFAFDPQLNEAGGVMLKTYDLWRQDVAAEKAEQVADWIAGDDRPMTDAIRASLVKAKAFRRQ